MLSDDVRVDGGTGDVRILTWYLPGPTAWPSVVARMGKSTADVVLSSWWLPRDGAAAGLVYFVREI